MRLFQRFKIDFLVIGTQKAGTSALDFYLRNHPKIGMGNEKELHFFDTDSNFKRSHINYSKYHKQFQRRKSYKIYGETTPSYIFWNPSIRRIKNYNEKIKLIAILRNPIERAYSHWNMEFSRNFETKDFFSSIKLELEILQSDCMNQDKISSYIQRGFYSQQIEKILKYFNQEQILFIKYEEFLEKQKLMLENVFRFLDVDDDSYSIPLRHIHNIKYIKTIDYREKEFLQEVFAEDILKVENLLGWDCSDWKNLRE